MTFSQPIRLFGTEEPAPAPRILKAGALTAEFDAGNLRHIRLGGVELIRAISFIVRDRNWGTYNPEITDLKIDESDGGFRVTYDARASDAAQAFHYRASIIGDASGAVTFSAEGEAETDFWTNRTGFVVLHPIVGVSGQPVRIEHADGTFEDSTFPELIDPVQPMMNLRALTHEAAPGLSVTCRMEGDVYEMEDQRNWTDASYKTYVRPLALPWPYELAKGEKLSQSVSLSVNGAAPAVASGDADNRIAIGEPAGAFPPLGVGLDPDEEEATIANAEVLRRAGLAHVICHYNPARGHGAEQLAGMLAAASAIGAEPWLEAVISSVPDYEVELNTLGEVVRALGSPFATVLVSPAPDLNCTLPGSVWPDAPPPEAFFKAARRAFPGARLGGGMFSYFTEMNRKRPPAELLDLVSFTTTATLHAGDDYSIMEGLESLPAIAASAQAIAQGKPIAVGPSAISMRMNPYGEAPMANPGNIRQAMNYNDPRHRGLLGAAWTLGFIARFAEGGATAITMGDTTGAFGLVSVPHDWPQPGYAEGGVFPLYHVMRGLARLHGLSRLKVRHPDNIEVLAVRTGAGTELWVANRTGQAQSVALPATASDILLLDESSFDAAVGNADALESLTQPYGGDRLDLSPYAVARLRW